MLIKALDKVKDEEITLEDVKRAEEIIARANKLLGRKETTCTHYHGWNGWWNVQTVPLTYPYYSTVTLCNTGATGTLTSATDSVNVSNLLASTSIVDAVS